jgi:restriction system protein
MPDDDLLMRKALALFVLGDMNRYANIKPGPEGPVGDLAAVRFLREMPPDLHLLFARLRDKYGISEDVTPQLMELVDTYDSNKGKRRPTLTLQSIILPEKPIAEGLLIRSTSLVWFSIIAELKGDWTRAYTLGPRVWEELVAGAYKQAGFDEVVLTPRSGDHGRDVIAMKHGVGSVRILGSVKAYRPGHLVTKEEVHALAGVVNLDTSASKGIFTTTSDFAPRLLADPYLAKAVPHRIELMNGKRLREWLVGLVGPERRQ